MRPSHRLLPLSLGLLSLGACAPAQRPRAETPPPPVRIVAEVPLPAGPTGPTSSELLAQLRAAQTPAGRAEPLQALRARLESAPAASASPEELHAARELSDLVRTLAEAHTLTAPELPVFAQPMLAQLQRYAELDEPSVQLRVAALRALEALGDRSAVEPVSRLLQRPLAVQDVHTARAAASLLGRLGDPRAVDALIYGLYLDIDHQNASLACLRALARLGPQNAVPRLVATLEGHNPEVEALLTQYAALPNAAPVPPDLLRRAAADALRVLGDSRAAASLLAVLRDTHADFRTRGSAAEALAVLASADPSQHEAAFTALGHAFTETPVRALTTEDARTHWIGPAVARSLAVLGDVRAAPLLLRAVRDPALASPELVGLRLELLGPYVMLVRHHEVAAATAQLHTVRAQLEARAQAHPAAEAAAPPLMASVTSLEAVLAVAHDCSDGDRACYERHLGDHEPEAARRAAQLLVQTARPADRAAVRTALLAHLDHPALLVRQAMLAGLDTLSPEGCAECATRLERVLSDEHEQESRALSHLEMELLLARLRTRGPHAGP